MLNILSNNHTVIPLPAFQPIVNLSTTLHKRGLKASVCEFGHFFYKAHRNDADHR